MFDDVSGIADRSINVQKFLVGANRGVIVTSTGCAQAACGRTRETNAWQTTIRQEVTHPPSAASACIYLQLRIVRRPLIVASVHVATFTAPTLRKVVSHMRAHNAQPVRVGYPRVGYPRDLKDRTTTFAATE